MDNTSRKIITYLNDTIFHPIHMGVSLTI